jgi:hypothetical protein
MPSGHGQFFAEMANSNLRRERFGLEEFRYKDCIAFLEFSFEDIRCDNVLPESDGVDGIIIHLHYWVLNEAGFRQGIHINIHTASQSSTTRHTTPHHTTPHAHGAVAPYWRRRWRVRYKSDCLCAIDISAPEIRKCERAR